MNKLRQRLLRLAQRYYLSVDLPSFLQYPLKGLESFLNENVIKDVIIKRPIFIVGCHRSGTTIFYETLARHPELAYFTNASSLYPDTSILNNQLMSWIGKNPQQIERFINDGLWVSHSSPSEGIRIWERFTSERETYVLDENEDNAEMEYYLKLNIKKHLRYMNRARFLNKNPDNSVRIRYLTKLFPDAYFIHIIRDGRAVCASLLKFRKAAIEFFGEGHRHAMSSVKGKDWPEISQIWETDPVLARGLLWKSVIETLERDRSYVPPEQYLEIRYEEFCQEPGTIFKDVCQFCQLPWNPDAFESAIASISLCNRNLAWQQVFNDSEISLLMNVIGETLHTYGYNN